MRPQEGCGGRVLSDLPVTVLLPQLVRRGGPAIAGLQVFLGSAVRHTALLGPQTVALRLEHVSGNCSSEHVQRSTRQPDEPRQREACYQPPAQGTGLPQHPKKPHSVTTPPPSPEQPRA